MEGYRGKKAKRDKLNVPSWSLWVAQSRERVGEPFLRPATLNWGGEGSRVAGIWEDFRRSKWNCCAANENEGVSTGAVLPVATATATASSASDPRSNDITVIATG